SASSIALVIWATRSATRASRVENTFSKVAIPDSKKIGVSATWMTWATKSSDESEPRKLGILLPLERDAIGELGIEMERILGPPLERRKIDMDQAKPSVIAERPLEIVEQRPHEITAHRHPGGDRVEHRPEIPAEIG